MPRPKKWSSLSDAATQITERRGLECERVHLSAIENITPRQVTKQLVFALMRESRLMPQADCDALEALLQGVTDVETLLLSMLREGHLTEYQASILLHGTSDGLRFDDYMAIEYLGSGGMAKVLKARDTRSGQVVALKVLSRQGLRRDLLNRFRQEVQATLSLDHPNLVKAYDFIDQPSHILLVMEYLQGRSLEQIVQQDGVLTVEKSLHYICQAAAGLAHAHRNGVIHRDVKPGNVHLSETVKVLDLGLALLPTAAERLTKVGMILGTPGYMAPEQYDDPKNVGPQADIYALGCTMYYLLTAKPAFTGNTALETLRAQRSNPVPRLSSHRDDIPIAVEQACVKMLARDPSERFATMDEVVAAF